MPSPSAERLDRIEQRLETNAKAWAEYRQWFQIGWSEATAHHMTFDQATHLRTLISTVETLGHALTATSHPVAEFVKAADLRVARVEAAIDTLIRAIFVQHQNGQSKQQS